MEYAKVSLNLPIALLQQIDGYIEKLREAGQEINRSIFIRQALRNKLETEVKSKNIVQNITATAETVKNQGNTLNWSFGK